MMKADISIEERILKHPGEQNVLIFVNVATGDTFQLMGWNMITCRNMIRLNDHTKEGKN